MEKRAGFFQNRKGLSIVIAALVVLLVLAVTWMFVIGRNVYFKDLETMNDAEFGVSFLVPDGWTPHSHAAGDLEFHPNDLGDESTPVRILVSSYGELTSNWAGLGEEVQKNIIEDLYSGVQSGEETYGFESSELTTINGNYGIYGETTEANSHYTSSMKGIAFVSVSPDGELHKIVAMSTPDIFTANKSGMNDVINSFDYTETE